MGGENWIEHRRVPGSKRWFSSSQISSFDTQGQQHPLVETTHSHSLTSHKLGCEQHACYFELESIPRYGNELIACAGQILCVSSVMTLHLIYFLANILRT